LAVLTGFNRIVACGQSNAPAAGAARCGYTAQPLLLRKLLKVGEWFRETNSFPGQSRATPGSAWPDRS